MITFKKLILELIIFIYFCYISAGVTILPSKTIDVIEGGSYLFELEDDDETNFCNCDYKSNLDNSWTTFHIDKPKNACVEATAPPIESVTFLTKLAKASNKNEIEDYGKYGKCKVNVKNVDDQGPSEWSLKPDDWNKTYHDQVDFKVNFFYAAPLLYKEISIFEGEDFFQYINSSLIFESCSLTFNGTTIKLNLKAEEAVMLKTDRQIDQQLLQNVSSLGRDLCGFRLNNASPPAFYEWTLTGVTNDMKQYRAVFLTKIFANFPASILHQEQVVQVGDSLLIDCKKEKPTELINYCKLYNSQEKLVFMDDKMSYNKPCSYQIESFQVDNYGVWKCFAGNTNTMKSIERTFKFVETESPYMTTWAEEKGDYLSIGCQLRNSNSKYFDYCKMTSPDQQFFSLRPGSATERYIALGTDFKNLLCEMQIKMPLRDDEIGMWRCETDLGGAFINVGSQAVADYQKYTKLTARLGKKLLIFCQVPYKSNFCHIKSPNGTRYVPKDQKEAWLGRCSHEIKTLEVYDNGTWTCSFAQTSGTPDEEILVEVTIADVLSYDPEVKATEDYPVSLLCKSGGLPLQYCQFIDPNGKSYYVDNNANSSYLSYHGEGIEYGECGIKIANAGKSDAGTWSCVIQLINEKKEISARVSVEVSTNYLSSSNLVLTLGLTVGIVAITSLFAIIGIRTIRQRRRGRPEIARSLSLRDGIHNDDQEDIFSLGVPPQSYDNPQSVRDDHLHQY